MSAHAGDRFKAACMHGEELKKAFKTYDKNSDGFIDKSELKNVRFTVGEKITDDDFEKMMQKADTDGDGKINYDEFVKMKTVTIACE